MVRADLLNRSEDILLALTKKKLQERGENNASLITVLKTHLMLY